MSAAPLFSSTSSVLCCYANPTNDPQIARIINIPGCQFERIVQPGQSILFQAAAIAQLEIHTFKAATIVNGNKIACAHLRVSDELIIGLLNHLS